MVRCFAAALPSFPQPWHRATLMVGPTQLSSLCWHWLGTNIWSKKRVSSLTKGKYTKDNKMLAKPITKATRLLLLPSVAWRTRSSQSRTDRSIIEVVSCNTTMEWGGHPLSALLFCASPPLPTRAAVEATIGGSLIIAPHQYLLHPPAVPPAGWRISTTRKRSVKRSIGKVCMCVCVFLSCLFRLQ